MKRIAAIAAIFSLAACEPPYSATRVVGANDDLAFGVESPDTTPPDIAVIALSGSDWAMVFITASEEVTFEAQINDFIGQKVNGTADPLHPYKWEIRGILSSSEYEIGVLAYDKAGNPRLLNPPYKFQTGEPRLQISKIWYDSLKPTSALIHLIVNKPCKIKVGFGTSRGSLVYPPLWEREVKEAGEFTWIHGGAQDTTWYYQFIAVTVEGEEAKAEISFTTPRLLDLTAYVKVDVDGSTAISTIFLNREGWVRSLDLVGPETRHVDFLEEAVVWREHRETNLPPGDYRAVFEVSDPLSGKNMTVARDFTVVGP